MAIDRKTESIESVMNELYWNSGQTIDEITNELGVGRNTLYASVQPLRTGVACPTCREALYFTNRTHRAAGSATCLACGCEVAVSDQEANVDWQAGVERRNGAGRIAAGAVGRATGIERDRAAIIGGGAALGAMLGAVAVRALRS